jgi:putative transposase
MRFRFIDSSRKAYPLYLLCKVMEVSRSGYYSWRKRGKSAREREREQLVPMVMAIHKKSRSTYGKRRIAEELQSEGISCGEHKAGTLMKLAGVEAKQKKKFKATTDSKHNMPVSPNLLKREFTVPQQDSVWVGDITYIWTSEGWLYLAVVIDLYSRRVVGWAINKRMTRQLVMDAVLMATWKRKPAPGLIFHSDRGSQYCSNDFKNLLKSHGLRSSMSRKGDCWDNAVAESFFGTLKLELVFWETYKTRIQAKGSIIEYIEMFYNSQRRHSYLGYLTPMEFEKELTLQKVA